MADQVVSLSNPEELDNINVSFLIKILLHLTVMQVKGSPFNEIVLVTLIGGLGLGLSEKRQSTDCRGSLLLRLLALVWE